ncbi:MAG: ABC transporter ATP-binding protein/permease [Planctomycetes bacterium]|nr:ABC transporter ATP-binding protein/permease [Planctomycetota bacterium]
MLRKFLKMLSFARPYWRFYLTGTAALVLVDIMDTFTPKLVQWAINHIEYLTSERTPQDYERLGNPVMALFGDSLTSSMIGGIWVYALGFVMIVAITGLFRYRMSLDYARASINLTHDLRARFFGHIQRLASRFHDRAKTGEMMSLATSDMDSVRNFFGFGLLLIIDTLLYFIMVPIYMSTISWKLMLASALCLPLIPLIVAKLAHAIEDRYDSLQVQWAVVAERSRESYAGAKVIKSFVQEDSEVRMFGRLSREYFRRGMHLAKVVALENPLLVLMLGLADLVVVIYGGSMVINGEITVGAFVAFFQWLIRLSGPMIGLGWVVMLYQRGRVSMNRIQRIISVKAEIVEPELPADVRQLTGAVEIKDLSFKYFPAPSVSAVVGDDDDEKLAEPDWALRHVSLKIEPGRTLAIVGPVGSGKSTLLGLIPRLYDPPSGTVFLGGHDVRSISLDVLRTQIGCVPQETFLFSETILQNIALGTLGNDHEVASAGKAHDADVEWLKQCARIAQVEQDVLSFPKQYDTLLGEKGVNLSGGQKQRVAIARAIARKPAILLLDDCLSAVDTQTEEAILKGLKGVMQQCTTVIVSHRVSTVEHADEIIVLDNGQIAERGTHEELLMNKGYYAELHGKQQLEVELNEQG